MLGYGKITEVIMKAVNDKNQDSPANKVLRIRLYGQAAPLETNVT